MNAELLVDVCERLGRGYLMGSKWQKCEAETIASQTIRGNAQNLRENGDAFSWLMNSALENSPSQCVENGEGLEVLLRDGSLVREVYEGPLPAPKGVAKKKGKPVILRVTDDLLQYVDKFIGKKRKQA